MKLKELLQAVNEKDLTKTQLEEYHTKMLGLFSLIELEIADLEKKEALYLDASEEKTEAAKERKWKVTDDGQRLIQLKRYSKVAEKQLSALKHRIFAVY